MKRNLISLKYFAESSLAIWILLFSIQISNIGPVPIKAIFLLVFLMLALVLMVNRRYVILANGWLICFVFGGLIISFVNGVFNGNYSAGNQLFVLLSSIGVVCFSIILYQNSMIQEDRLEAVMYLTAIIAIVIKILVVVAVIFGIISAGDLNSFMQIYMGSSGFDMSADNGFMGLVPRVGNSGDVVYLIIFLFYSRKKNIPCIILFWILILLMVLISNSRYLYILFILVNILLLSVGVKKSFEKLFVVIVASVVIIIFYAFSWHEPVWDYIVDRYTGDLSIEADSQRAEQGLELFKYFKENVFFGIGMGGYLDHLIRNEERVWHYEVEYFSMLMQFGIIGFLMIFFCYISWVVLQIFKSYNKKLKMQIILSLVIFLVTPFQSALFIGSSGAFVLLVIYFMTRNKLN